MRVLQLLPELKVGGVERGTVDLSEYLVSQGHESAVVSGGGQLVELLSQHGAKHFQLPIAKKNLTAVMQIKNLKNLYCIFQPDIVHVRSRFPAWINYFALRNSPSNSPKIISTFHGLYSKPFYSKSMSYADEIIAISKTVKDYIHTNYQVSPEHLHLIYRGCDTEEFNLQMQDKIWLDKWYEEFPQTKTKTVLTLPGRITGWKGIEQFIELFTRLDTKKYHGLIPGPVNANKNKYFQTLEELIDRCNLKSDITFCGARSDIANIYKISDIVFNLSSKPEPFGRTIIEAAACGTHVMGWNLGGVKESIEMINPLGLITHGDIEELANYIPRMLAQPTPKTIPNIFTKEHLVQATVKVYEQALSASE